MLNGLAYLLLATTTTAGMETMPSPTINSGSIKRTGNNKPQGEITNGNNNFLAMNYNVNSLIILVTQKEFVVYSPIITSNHVPTMLDVETNNRNLVLLTPEPLITVHVMLIA